MKTLPIIKVCGLSRHTDNKEVLTSPTITHLGFIFSEKSSRYVRETPLSSGKERVGVFVNADESYVIRQIRKHSLTAVQFHGSESPEYCAIFRQHATVIKAFGIRSRHDVSSSLLYTEAADLFLFDTKTAMHGGSGCSFDWNLLHSGEIKKPFILSGGIGHDSLEKLQLFNHPLWCGIDLNSRFETAPGIKNAALLHTFFSSLQHAYNTLLQPR